MGTTSVVPAPTRQGRASDAATAFWRGRSGEAWCAHYEASGAAPQRKALLAQMSRVWPFESALEIGCHVGPNLARLHEHFPGIRLFGVEVNPEAVAWARRRFQSTPQIRIIEGNLLDVLPPWEARTVDLAFSWYTLAYIAPDDLPGVLSHLCRITRKALVLAEPMGWAGLVDAPAPVPYPEWRHPYPRAVAEAVHQSGRQARIYLERVQPPMDRLDGIVTAVFEPEESP